MKHFKFLLVISFFATALISSTGCTDSKAKQAADSIVANMVRVDGGTFKMGTNEYDYEYQMDRGPVHNVTVSTFYICKYEVTQQEWEAIMGKNPSTFKEESPKNPVETVSWLDCQEFIKRLNELTGKKFRLPTEAEWEFAARGGNKSKGYKFAGNDDAYEVGCVCTNYEQATQEVGLLPPNELGLYDMTGNVIELCSDVYGPYSDKDQINPKGAADTTVYRVGRGGGWCNASRNCTVTHRQKVAKHEYANGVGLRLVMDAK
ncbi:MAG: formylglycine-generating enzyme family protein [Muribaculaceae bacterium]|nr:formylglycine-generating enzyme family protein [Muribaculaceae bacterium]